MDLLIKDIDLRKNYDSGQIFNWHDIGNETYIVPIKASLFKLKQLDKDTASLTLIKGNIDDIGDYFDFNRNYALIYDKIAKEHPELADGVSYTRGIRLFKQDYLEMIITFMFSANNNIPRIKASINHLREKLGEKITEYNGITYYEFPKLERLSEFSEADFKEIGAGYRANYLFETIKKLSEDKAYNSWDALETKDLINKLKTLKGIGPKVAHCIALFAYGRWDVFPVDTWVKKALFSVYGMENINEKVIEKELLEKFADNSALVQQILFYCQKEQKK